MQLIKELMCRTIAFLLFLNTALSSCNNVGDIKNGDYKINVDSISQNSIVVGSWSNVKTVVPKEAELIIDEYGEFNFKSKRHMTNAYSNGTYTIFEDTLILQSTLPDTCLYKRIFGHDLIPIEEAINSFSKPSLTINGCKPKSKTVYIEFNKSLFLIKKDTLSYIGRNNNLDSLNTFFR